MKNEWLENEEKSLKCEMKRRIKMKRGTFKEAWEKYWLNYIAIIALTIMLFYKCKGMAEDHHMNEMSSAINRYELANISAFENQCETKILCHFYTMNAEYDQCKTFAEKRDFHKKNAERCLNDAKNLCWYFPNSIREDSFYAFRNMAILASPGDPKSKIITALITTLIQYGADCFESWNDINTKLNWSQYHYEMHEFYSDLVKHGHN